jgi:hypothetical protein
MTGVRDIKGSTVRLLADNAIIGATVNEQVVTSFGVPTTPATFVATYTTGLSFTTTSMGALITYSTSVTTTTVLTSKMPTGAGTVNCSITTSLATNDTILITPSWNTPTGIIKGAVITTPIFVTTGTATATSTITTTSTPTITCGISVNPGAGSISGDAVTIYQITVPVTFWGGLGSGFGQQISITVPFEIFANTAAPSAAIRMAISNNCSQTVAIYNNQTIVVTIY